jgi:hypothetical protein
MNLSEVRYIFWDGSKNVEDNKIDSNITCKQYYLLADPIVAPAVLPPKAEVGHRFAADATKAGVLGTLPPKEQRTILSNLVIPAIKVRIMAVDQWIVPATDLLAIKLRLRFVDRIRSLLLIIRSCAGDPSSEQAAGAPADDCKNIQKKEPSKIIYREILKGDEVKRLPKGADADKIKENLSWREKTDVKKTRVTAHEKIDVPRCLTHVTVEVWISSDEKAFDDWAGQDDPRQDRMEAPENPLLPVHDQTQPPKNPLELWKSLSEANWKPEWINSARSAWDGRIKHKKDKHADKAGKNQTLIGCSLIEEIMAGGTNIKIFDREPSDRLWADKGQGHRKVGDSIGFPEFRSLIRRTMYEVCRYSALGMVLLETVAKKGDKKVCIYPSQNFYPHIGGAGINKPDGFPDDYEYMRKVTALTERLLDTKPETVDALIDLENTENFPLSEVDTDAKDLISKEPVISDYLKKAKAYNDDVKTRGAAKTPVSGARSAARPGGVAAFKAPAAKPPGAGPTMPPIPGAGPTPPPAPVGGPMPPPAPGGGPMPPPAPVGGPTAPPSGPAAPVLGGAAAAPAVPVPKPTVPIPAIKYAVKRYFLRKIGAVEPAKGCDSNFYFNLRYITQNFRDNEYACRYHRDEGDKDYTFGTESRKIKLVKMGEGDGPSAASPDSEKKAAATAPDTKKDAPGKASTETEKKKDLGVFIETPLFLAFLHEMIHARRFQTGLSGEHDEYPEAVPGSGESTFHPDSMAHAMYLDHAAAREKIEGKKPDVVASDKDAAKKALVDYAPIVEDVQPDTGDLDDLKRSHKNAHDKINAAATQLKIPEIPPKLSANLAQIDDSFKSIGEKDQALTEAAATAASAGPAEKAKAESDKAAAELEVSKAQASARALLKTGFQLLKDASETCKSKVASIDAANASIKEEVGQLPFTNFLERYGKFNREEFDTIEGSGVSIELSPDQEKRLKEVNGIDIKKGGGAPSVTVTENALRKELCLPFRRRYEDNPMSSVVKMTGDEISAAKKRRYIKPGKEERETAPEAPPETPFVLEDYLVNANREINRLLTALLAGKKAPLMIRDKSFMVPQPAHFIVAYQFKSIVNSATSDESIGWAPKFIREVQQLPKLKPMIDGIPGASDRLKAMKVLQGLYNFAEPELLSYCQKGSLAEVYSKAKDYDAFAGYRMDIPEDKLTEDLGGDRNDPSTSLNDYLAAYLSAGYANKNQHNVLHSLIHEPTHLLSYKCSGFDIWDYSYAGGTAVDLFDVRVDKLKSLDSDVAIKSMRDLFGALPKPKAKPPEGHPYDITVPLEVWKDHPLSKALGDLVAEQGKLGEADKLAEQVNSTEQARLVDQAKLDANGEAAKQARLANDNAKELQLKEEEQKLKEKIQQFSDREQQLKEKIRLAREQEPQLQIAVQKLKDKVVEEGARFRNKVVFKNVPSATSDLLIAELKTNPVVEVVSKTQKHKFFEVQMIRVTTAEAIYSVLNEGATEMFTRIVSYRLNEQAKEQAVQVTTFAGFYSYEYPHHIVCQIVRDLKSKGKNGLALVADAYFKGEWGNLNSALLELSPDAGADPLPFDGRYSMGFWEAVSKVGISNDQARDVSTISAAIEALRDTYKVDFLMVGELIEAIRAKDDPNPSRRYHDPVCCKYSIESGTYTPDPLAPETPCPGCHPKIAPAVPPKNPQPLPFKCPNCEEKVEVPGDKVLKDAVTA